MHASVCQRSPTRLGFAGTPILTCARKKTHDIFGPRLDIYTLRESEAGGSTVLIFFAIRAPDGAVKGALLTV
jgi:type I restriction enzyme R subunit